MHKQPTAEEYDLAFLEAKRDLATNDSVSHTPIVEGDEFITRESFFRDLRKASQRIKPKPSLKSSKT